MNPGFQAGRFEIWSRPNVTPQDAPRIFAPFGRLESSIERIPAQPENRMPLRSLVVAVEGSSCRKRNRDFNHDDLSETEKNERRKL